MSDLGWIIVITAIAGVGGTGLGGVVGALLRRDSSRIVSLLLAFAGGIMTGVVCFDMINRALQPERRLGAGERVFRRGGRHARLRRHLAAERLDRPQDQPRA
ncbi:MAG: hypothetical protein ACLTSG_15395 [Lachnospiraceae bacterium]